MGAYDSEGKPRITSIEIENFKSIRDRVKVNIKPITLLFGANSSGKSSVLQAINFVREIIVNRNLTPKKLMPDGRLVDIGNYWDIVNNHDSSKPIIIKFNLDISSCGLPSELVNSLDEILEDSDKMESITEIPHNFIPNEMTSSLLKNPKIKSIKLSKFLDIIKFKEYTSIENCSIEICIKPNERNKVEVASCTISINNERIVRFNPTIENDYIIADIAFDHHIFVDSLKTQERSKSFTDEDKLYKSLLSKWYIKALKDQGYEVQYFNISRPEASSLLRDKKNRYATNDNNLDINYNHARAQVEATEAEYNKDKEPTQEDLERWRISGGIKSKADDDYNEFYVEHSGINQNKFESDLAAEERRQEVDHRGRINIKAEESKRKVHQERKSKESIESAKIKIYMRDDRIVLERSLFGSLPVWDDILSIVVSPNNGYTRYPISNYTWNSKVFLCLVKSIIAGPFKLLSDCLLKWGHLGSLRSPMTRDYIPQRHDRDFRWQTGLAAWDTLYDEDVNSIDKISSWLGDNDKLDMGYYLKKTDYREVEIDGLFHKAIINKTINQKSLIELFTNLRSYSKIHIVPNGNSSLLLAPPDVGTGISQTLPVIVAAIEKKYGYFSIEEPEQHLHPKAQVRLGDLFIQNIKDGKVFILETHSEHLLLRLLRRIRETTKMQNNKSTISSDKINLIPDQLSVNFIEIYKNRTIVTKIRVDEDGDFVDRWPRGFFAERAEELFS